MASLIGALDALRAVHQGFTDLAQREKTAVADARAHGVVWRRIAEELGTTQPYATRKFKPHVDTHTAPPTHNDGESALHTIRAIQGQRTDLEQRRLHAVADAITAGATWQQIGDALGTAGPNAHAKYNPLLVHKTVTAEEGTSSS